VSDTWIDLHDPTDDDLMAAGIGPGEVHETVWERLRERPENDDAVRARFESHGTYVFGVLAVPLLEDHGPVVFQEIDVVITADRLITVHKHPESDRSYGCDHLVEHAHRTGESSGGCLHALIDDVAERFLDIVEEFEARIDRLEDDIEDGNGRSARRETSHLRHDMLRTRRVLTPIRDVTRAIVTDRLDLGGHDRLDREQVFPHDIEIRFHDCYDKLLRATDGLDLTRDLLANVRDFQQSQVAVEQNEVMKKLAAIASLLLLPTFIVGLYGQNFERMPELTWPFGYLFSWGLIVATTAAQLLYFRRKGWLGSPDR
jgi:magnesium transporter